MFEREAVSVQTLTDATGRERFPWVAALVSLGIVTALLVLAASKISLQEVTHALGAVNPGWVAAAVCLMLAAFLSRAESWFAVIRSALPGWTGNRLAVIKVLMIGMATSALAPGRIGEAARAWLIARRTGGTRDSLATAVGTLVSQVLLNLLALLILTAIALGGDAIPGSRAVTIPVAVALPLGIALALWIGPQLLEGVHERSRGTRARWAGWLGGQLTRARQGVAICRKPAVAAHSSAFQLGAWSLQCACCYAVLRAFDLGAAATIPTAAAVLVAVNITAILPLTPSNVGIFQGACIAVLTRMHVPASTALAYGIVLQAVEVVTALAIGLPALVHEGLSFAEMRRTVGPADPATHRA